MVNMKGKCPLWYLPGETVTGDPVVVWGTLGFTGRGVVALGSGVVVLTGGLVERGTGLAAVVVMGTVVVRTRGLAVVRTWGLGVVRTWGLGVVWTWGLGVVLAGTGGRTGGLTAGT